MNDSLRIARLLEHALRLMRGGHIDQSIDVLTRVLGEEPDHGDAHAILAFCLVSRKRLHAANLEASQAVGLDPDSHLAHLAMASVQIARRAFKQAETHIDAARTLAPEHAENYRLAASLYGRRSFAPANTHPTTPVSGPSTETSNTPAAGGKRRACTRNAPWKSIPNTSMRSR
jgi:Flp pilus assembly protein TadD